MKKIILALILSLWCSLSWATTTTFNGKDALFYDFSTNEHIEASGGLYTVRSNRYGLYYFDISSIPTNATVSSATMTFYRLETNASGGNAALYYNTDPNSTGGGTVYTWCGSTCDVFNQHATYAQKKHQATQIHWDNSSNNFTVNRTLIGNSSVFSIFSTGQFSFTVTSIVQTWVTTPSSNLGFQLVPGSSGDPVCSIATYLDGTPSNRPVLSVTYTTGGAFPVPDMWRNPRYE